MNKTEKYTSMVIAQCSIIILYKYNIHVRNYLKNQILIKKKKILASSRFALIEHRTLYYNKEIGIHIL